MGGNESHGAVPPFRCEVSWNEGTLFVKAFGEIDLSTAAVLGSSIESRNHSAPQVVVDLSGVCYLDTAALNTLVRARRRLEKDAGFRVVLGAGQHIAMKVFEITQLTEYLNVAAAARDDRVGELVAGSQPQ